MTMSWVNKHIKMILGVGLASFSMLVLMPLSASAINPLPIPPPGSGSYGLEATKRQPPPTTGATISIPGSGASFTTSPITVSGICPTGLLVQVYNNDVMVGSVMCTNGSFSLQVSLFQGENQITARVYDDLDQAGPLSNVATVNFNNANFSGFSSPVTLTSNFGRRGAAPGSTLTWPLQLSGGTGPYAFSIDWGDGTPPELKSQAAAGLVNLSHVFSKAGIYTVSIKVTDSQGATGFIQLVAVANGNVNAANTSSAPAATTTGPAKVLWLPAAICLILLVPAYWLGRQSVIAAKRR